MTPEFFSTGFRKIVRCQNFMKIRLLGAEVFHAERRTDMTSCNIYAVQQDTQSFLMSEFIHHVC